LKRVPSSELTPDSDCNDGVYYHDGKPFTGISFSLHRNGSIRSETEFRDGLEWGISKSCYPSGALAKDIGVARGGLHGRKREWRENGQLALDEQWELGICLRRQKWNEQGELEVDFTLQPGDQMFEMLQSLRKWAAKMEHAELASGASE
jgi:antitoxin component YwqK of YwqJK toxin-antitoxin module